MSERAAKRLRELVEDYYHGLISRESYRRERAELLDRVISGDADAEPTTTRPRAQATGEVRVAADRETPPPRTDHIAPVPQAPAGVPTPIWLVIGGLTIAVILAGIWYFSGPDIPPEQPAVVPEEPAEAPVAAAPDPLRSLVIEFLSLNDWGDRSVRAFLDAWRSFSPEQHEAARAASWFQSLGNALRRRVKEQQALDLALGGESPEAGLLRQLGMELGVEIAVTPISVAGEPPPALATETSPPEGRDDIPPGRALPGQPSPEAAPPVAAAPAPQAAPPRAGRAGDAAVEDDRARVAKAPPPATPQPVSGAPAESSTKQLAVVQPAAGTSVAEAATRVDACTASLARSRRPYCRDALGDGAEGPQLVILPAGEFSMGSNAVRDEAPPHEVKISQAFAMSMHEISYAEYRPFCASTGSCPNLPWPADDYPVVLVSWYDAGQYAAWLSAATGHAYRLPSEAEWEYAARAGTRTTYPFGDEILVSHARFSHSRPVTSPLPQSDRSTSRNPFRLFHIVGNVREWVADGWYPDYRGAPGDGSARPAQGDARVVRGGSFADPGSQLRSSARHSLQAGNRDQMTGFRLVREIVR